MDTISQVKEPLVSVLMLTYNRGHFLSEAISSVLSQTYQNFELVIIDDGSTDNSENVIQGFADKRLRYIKHEKNAGLFARRKESLSYVTGKYVAVIDSDDVWIDKEKLTKQVESIETNASLAVVGTQTRLINRDGKKIKDYFYETTDKAIRRKILVRNQFTHSAVLMRAAALEKTQGYQPTLAEDLDLFLQLGHFGEFKNLPIIATAHRVHDASENDHGSKMSTAVLAIIKKRHLGYPGYLFALLLGQLRLLKHRLIKTK
ncbi:MAG TPA: glycosyltransferase [Candidatus Paceibacterota bacterium]|nr:glycosyltransferase [Candidatus Paceibacterota bacterium]HMO82770.1 glycosyltransferase [Candidatus Paceibacterota bacterium]